MKPMRFSKHYTLEEARSLLPSIRQWLAQLDELRGKLRTVDQALDYPVHAGSDMGGQTVNAQVRLLAEIQEIVHQFNRRQIRVKDFSRGLVDFPSIRGGVEVFLCWEKDEEDIEFWHDLDSGFAGRERI